MTYQNMLPTTANWIAKERDLALSAILRLVGMKVPARPNANQTSLSAAIRRREQSRRERREQRAAFHRHKNSHSVHAIERRETVRATGLLSIVL
jgi:hypothetical protein